MTDSQFLLREAGKALAIVLLFLVDVFVMWLAVNWFLSGFSTLRLPWVSVLGACMVFAMVRQQFRKKS